MGCYYPFPEVGLKVGGEGFEDSGEDLAGEGFVEEGKVFCYCGEGFEEFTGVGRDVGAEFFAVLGAEGGPMQEIGVLAEFFEEFSLNVGLD